MNKSLKILVNLSIILLLTTRTSPSIANTKNNTSSLPKIANSEVSTSVIPVSYSLNWSMSSMYGNPINAATLFMAFYDNSGNLHSSSVMPYLPKVLRYPIDSQGLMVHLTGMVVDNKYVHSNQKITSYMKTLGFANLNKQSSSQSDEPINLIANPLVNNSMPMEIDFDYFAAALSAVSEFGINFCSQEAITLHCKLTWSYVQPDILVLNAVIDEEKTVGITKIAIRDFQKDIINNNNK